MFNGEPVTDYYLTDYPPQNVTLSDAPGSTGAVIPWPNIVWFVVCLLLLVTGAPGNLFIIITVLFRRRLHNAQNIALANLTLSGGLFFLIVLPFVTVTVLIGRWPTGHVGCQIIGFTCMFSFVSSIINIANLAYFRYICIVIPAVYKRFQRKRYIALNMAIIWTIAGLASFPPLIGWGRIRFVPKYHTCIIDFTSSFSYTTFMSITLGFIPLCIIVFSYVKVFLTFRKSRKAVADIGHRAIKKADIRLAVHLGVIVMLFCLCYYPLLICAIILDPYRKWPALAYHFILKAIIVYGVVCPLLNYKYNKSLQRETVKLLFPCCYKRCVKAGMDKFTVNSIVSGTNLSGKELSLKG